MTTDDEIMIDKEHYCLFRPLHTHTPHANDILHILATKHGTMFARRLTARHRWHRDIRDSSDVQQRLQRLDSHLLQSSDIEVKGCLLEMLQTRIGVTDKVHFTLSGMISTDGLIVNLSSAQMTQSKGYIQAAAIQIQGYPGGLLPGELYRLGQGALAEGCSTSSILDHMP
jgi:hypothetical protein